MLDDARCLILCQYSPISQSTVLYLNKIEMCVTVQTWSLYDVSGVTWLHIEVCRLGACLAISALRMMT